jgi:hypothetical protein
MSNGLMQIGDGNTWVAVNGVKLETAMGPLTLAVGDMITISTAFTINGHTVEPEPPLPNNWLELICDE